MSGLLTGLGLRVLIGVIAAGALAGGLVWFGHHFYAQGRADTERRVAAEVAIKGNAVLIDANRLRKLGPDGLKAERLRLCREQGGSEETCK